MLDETKKEMSSSSDDETLKPGMSSISSRNTVPDDDIPDYDISNDLLNPYGNVRKVPSKELIAHNQKIIMEREAAKAKATKVAKTVIKGKIGNMPGGGSRKTRKTRRSRKTKRSRRSRKTKTGRKGRKTRCAKK